MLIKRRQRAGVNDAAVITGCILTSKRWPSHLEQHGEVTGRGVGGEGVGGCIWGGGGKGVIDAAPACEAHSVIVINNSGLAIWAQTGQFVCPQSRLDKWS